jgi:hypothetical protein
MKVYLNAISEKGKSSQQMQKKRKRIVDTICAEYCNEEMLKERGTKEKLNIRRPIVQ